MSAIIRLRTKYGAPVDLRCYERKLGEAAPRTHDYTMRIEQGDTLYLAAYVNMALWDSNTIVDVCAAFRGLFRGLDLGTYTYGARLGNILALMPLINLHMETSSVLVDADYAKLLAAYGKAMELHEPRKNGIQIKRGY